MTDAALPYAEFPAYRFKRIGMSDAAIAALALGWAALSPDAQEGQGLLIASSPDGAVANIAANFPAPLDAAVKAVKGPNPPTNPIVDDLWYDTVNDVMKRWNGSTWVTGSAGSSTDATARASAAAAQATATTALSTASANVTAISTLSTTVTGHTTQIAKRIVSGPVHGTYSVTQAKTNGTDTGGNTLSRFTASTALDSWSLTFTNSACGSNGDLDADNLITVMSAVGLTATGPWWPVSVRGSRTITLDPGEAVDTDPIYVHVNAGAFYYVKTFVSVTSGLFWTMQGSLGILGTDYWVSHSNGEADLHLSTAAFTPVSGNRPYSPVRILSHTLSPNTPSVVIIGDSIPGGIGDVTNNSNTGFMVMALKGLIPFQRICVSGSKLAGIVDPAVSRRRMAVTRGANIFVDEYGVNDYTAGTSLATCAANKILLWNQQMALGRKGFALTHTPILGAGGAGTTDAYATLVNQTPHATGDPTRLSMNAWYRDGSPILNGAYAAPGTVTAGTLRAGQPGHPLYATSQYPQGCIDVAATVESSLNSSKWIVTGAANYATADGTHPTTAAHTLMAAAVLPAAFTAAVA